MHLGVMMFPTDKAIDPISLAKEVEDRGFESLWFPEHSHIPTSRATPWGGREGAPPRSTQRGPREKRGPSRYAGCPLRSPSRKSTIWSSKPWWTTMPAVQCH